MINTKRALLICLTTLMLIVAGCSNGTIDESKDVEANLPVKDIVSIQRLDATKELAADSDINEMDRQIHEFIDFAKINFNIDISSNHVYLDTPEDIKVDGQPMRILASSLSNNNTLRLYYNAYSNNITGVSFDEESPIIFEEDFDYAHHWAKELFYDYRENTLTADKKFPILFEDGSYRFTFNRLLDNKPYEIYVDANYNEDRLYSIKDIDNNKYYDVIEKKINHDQKSYDSKYSLTLAKDTAEKYLNMDEATLKIELGSNELELPWFTDTEYYSDICWLVTASDKNTSYSIYVSAYTGEVCEITGEYIEYMDPSKAIDKTEARALADNYFSSISPNKVNDHIFIGYSSIYANGWTAFKYAKADESHIYLNEIVVVYLNIDGTLNSFYQSVRLED